MRVRTADYRTTGRLDNGLRDWRRGGDGGIIFWLPQVTRGYQRLLIARPERARGKQVLALDGVSYR